MLLLLTRLTLYHMVYVVKWSGFGLGSNYFLRFRKKDHIHNKYISNNFMCHVPQSSGGEDPNANSRGGGKEGRQRQWVYI